MLKRKVIMTGSRHISARIVASVFVEVFAFKTWRCGASM